jgi:hypothetical protein
MERFYLKKDTEAEELYQFKMSKRSAAYEIWMLKCTCDIVGIRHSEEAKTTVRGSNRLLRVKAA